MNYVIIKKGSTKFPSNSVCPIISVDTEKVDQFTKQVEMEEKGEITDEDDDSYFEEVVEPNTPSPVLQVVITLFLLPSPINGKFYWVDSERCRHYDSSS